MSSSEYNRLSKRLDQLMGLFFDGALDEIEDQELVAIVSGNDTFATRFMDHISIERTLVGVASGRLVNDRFISSVKRKAIRADEMQFGSSSFAKAVVNKITNVSVRKPKRRKARASIRSRRASVPTSNSFTPMVGLVAAAMLLLLGVFVALSSNTNDSNQIRQLTDNGSALSHSKENVESVATATAPEGKSQNTNILANAARPEGVTSKQSSLAETGVERMVPPASDQDHVEVPLTARTANKVDSSLTRELKNGNVLVDAASKKIAQITDVDGVKAIWARASADIAGGPVSKSDQIFNGDVIKVAGTTNPKASPLWSSGVEVVLAEGVSILIKPGAVLRMVEKNGKVEPQLEAGTCLLRVGKNAGGVEGSIASRSTARVVMSEGLCSISRNDKLEWVLVSVIKGRAKVLGKGAEQIVPKNFGCLTRFGTSPEKPFLQKLSSITGYSESTDDGAGAKGDGKNSGGAGAENKSGGVGNGKGNGSDGSGNGNGKGPGNSGNKPGVGVGNGGGRSGNKGGGAASGGNRGGNSGGNRGGGASGGNRGGGASGGNRGGGNRGGGASGGRRGGGASGGNRGGGGGRGRGGRF